MREQSKRDRWYAVVLLASALTLGACSGATGNQPKDPPPIEAGEADGDGTEAIEAPAKPVEVVYTAEASDESVQRIESAIDDAIEGRIAEATRELESVLDDDDQAFLAAFNLGILLEQDGRTKQARDAYERSLSIEPEFSPALLNIVRLDAREGRDPVTVAERYVSERPESVGHQLARLEALVLQSRYDDVVDGARDVLKRDEANPRARYYLALAHFSGGRYPLAGYITTEALKIQTEDPELYFLHGMVQLELDKEPAARNAFEAAVRLRPDYPEAQNALGLLLYKNRDFADAEAAFRMSIRYAPGFPEPWLNLGNALKAMNRGDDAEGAYKKALELKPNWADAHFSLGALYLATEVVELQSVKDLARLEAALSELKLAHDGWTEADLTKLADQFIAKADKAILYRKAELEAEALEKEGGGGGDPFGDGGDAGDPFDDGADDGDPFDDSGSTDGGSDGGSGGGDDDPFDDGDPFE